MSQQQSQSQRRQRAPEPLPQSKKGQIIKARKVESRNIENDARMHLNTLLTHIAAEDTSDISLIQRKYSQEVYDIIRAAANNAFIVGINYTASIKQRMHTAYVNTTDVGIIKSLTDEFSAIFWRRVANVLHQKDIIHSILQARFSPRSSLTLGNLVNGFVVRLVTKAVALGTLAKVPAFAKQTITKSAATDDSEPVEIMEWHTQEDERVCPFCDELDGQQWKSDDPDMQIPGEDSHDGCRCTLDIAYTPDI